MGSKWVGYEKYEPEWNDSWPVRKVVRNEIIGDVLLFPSGQSAIDGMHADIDKSLNPDIVADLEENPFAHNPFDTVYSDPPYSMYWGNTDWIRDLWSTAREKLILQTPNTRIHLPNATKKWVLVEPDPGSEMRWVRSLQIFAPESNSIGSY